MIEKSVIRIGILLLALVLVTASIVYLTANNAMKIKSNEQYIQRMNRVSSVSTQREQKITAPLSQQKQEQNFLEKASHQEKNKAEQSEPFAPQLPSKEATISSTESNYFFQNIDEIPLQIVSFSPTSSREKPETSSLPVSSESETSSSSSETSSESFIITKEDTLQLAKEMSKKHQISIFIAYSGLGIWKQGMQTYAQDYQKVYQQLKAIDALCSEISYKRFNEFGCLEFLLVGSHNGSQTLFLEEACLLVSVEKAASLTVLREEMFQLFSLEFAQRVSEDFVEEYISNNPEDFIYGINVPRYIYHKDEPYRCYFYTEKAQESIQSDISSIVYGILLEQTALNELPSLSTLFPKLSLISGQIWKEYPSMRDNKIIKRTLESVQ